MDSTFTPTIFGDIADLTNDIMIANGKFMNNENIDTKFGLSIPHYDFIKNLGHEDKWISFRDIVNLFTRFLRDRNWGEEIPAQIYHITMEFNPQYPFQYLLFDYCLAALGDNLTDAHLYLEHSFRILHMEPIFHMFLECIICEKLIHDSDVRRFLLVLANTIQPVSAPSYIDRFGPDFKNRFEIYQKEMEQIDSN